MPLSLKAQICNSCDVFVQLFSPLISGPPDSPNVPISSFRSFSGNLRTISTRFQIVLGRLFSSKKKIRRAACPGVAQPSVVRDKCWLQLLHGAAHANWGLSIPPWGLKNQALQKNKKCNTFQAKLRFSWLRITKTRTPSICGRPRERQPELILGGLLEGVLFFGLFFASFFFGFLVVWDGFGTPWGGSKSVKIAKSWFREPIFE